MSQREPARLRILNRVLAKQTTLAEAARLLGVSERHGWRLLTRYRAQGTTALVHDNRGRPLEHRSRRDRGRRGERRYDARPGRTDGDGPHDAAARRPWMR